MRRSLILSFALCLFLSACQQGKKINRSIENPAIDKSNSEMKWAKSRTDAFMVNLLSAYPQFFDTVLIDRDKLNVQIIYSQIDRKKNGSPIFSDHFFNLNQGQYFYPASTVKLPIALLTLQKLHELNIPGLDINTTMITDSSYSGQTAVRNDPSSSDGRPTIAQYIKKILLVSDNDAFNRLYEFLGQEYINNTLHKMGYESLQIIHRLNIFLSEDENRHTNRVRFYDKSGKLIYEKPAANSQLVYIQRNTKLGKGFMRGDQLVNEPFDFSKKNRLLLQDLHNILKSVIFPESVPVQQRFDLTKEDYDFVYQYMSMFPRESKYPAYDSSYSDAYSKFLLWGESIERQPGTIRIFHKSGDAYGFMIDAAYVVDFTNNIEFMVTATIYSNSDGIFNDDKYDYQTVGYPFFKHLGEVIYQYELKRKRKNVPDLSSMKFDYSKQFD